MTPAQIFQLAVRLLGLYLFYLGASSLVGAFIRIPHGSFWRSLLEAAFLAALAWWMLGGAKLLVDRAYPHDAPRSDSPRV
ncbi:MAG: hypothetical protein GC161_14580 [Planctomycetaceae bacterium]|nr:hypothetical protein [Planctomycetaceae bacterium]